MAVFTFEDLLNSQVYKSALPEDKKKLEAKYREQFGDTAEAYLESAPETVVKSEGFDQLPPQEKLRMVREAKEKASIIEQDFEARRARARQDVSKDALLAQDQVIPERGWKDPVNWLAGITGGARAGLWRVGGPGSPLANASAGGISETFGQVLATETVAEAGQALGEMAAEKIGTPSAGPALALLAHMGGHATASQLFKGLRAMGYDDELASRMASITWKATESDKSLIPASRAVYEGVLDQKRMLNPVASRPHENPSTGKIDVDDIPLAASRKLSGRQMLDKVVNVNKIAEQAEAFREIVQKTVAKYISDDALAGGDQGKPLGIVDDTFIDGQFRSNARKANKRVESPRDSASTQSGRFFPNPEDFEATVDSTLKSQIGTSVGKPKEKGPIRGLLEMGFASLRDKVADTKLGKKAQNLSSTYIDKEKIKNVVNNFTKYEYGKDPAFVTARDLSNNMSGRVINDARNLVKRGRYLATKHNLSHEEIDSLLRGKNTNPDLPDEVVGIVKSLRRMIDDLGVDRETYRLLSSSSREEGEGSYLPRLYAMFEHPEYFDFDNANRRLLDPAAHAMAKKYNMDVTKAREELGKIIDEAQTRVGKQDEYHPEWLSLKRSMLRDDLPQEVRELFGEIADPFYLAYRGVKDQAMDLQHALVFDYITRNNDLFSFTQKPGWVKLSERVNNVKMSGDVNNRFGAIADGYVPEHVARELAHETPKPSEWRRAWDLHMSLWKKMMVPLSPRTVFRNIVSDSMMKYVGGMAYSDQVRYMKRAWKEYMYGTKYGYKSEDYRLAERLGLFEGNFLSSDRGMLQETVIPDKLYRGQDQTIEFIDRLNTRNPVLQMMHMANRFVDTVGSSKLDGKGVGERASEFYSNWENASKLSMFKYFMENGRPTFRSEVNAWKAAMPETAGRVNGMMLKQMMQNQQMTPEQAVAYVNKFLFDYSKLPKHLQTARGTTHPFIAYPYLAGKALMHAIDEQPDRVFFLLVQLGILTKAIETATDTELSPGDLMPYGHMWDGGNDNNPVPGVLRPLLPSGPAVLPAELLTGHSARTHWDIGNPAEHIAKSELPSIATYHGKDIAESMVSGDPSQQIQAILNGLLGVKVKPRRE